MTTLLDHLYEDTRKKVAAVVNFSNPDSMITMSMDGWQAPTGEHIRNYMWVCDNATFFFTHASSEVLKLGVFGIWGYYEGMWRYYGIL